MKIKDGEKYLFFEPFRISDRNYWSNRTMSGTNGLRLQFIRIKFDVANSELLLELIPHTDRYRL